MPEVEVGQVWKRTSDGLTSRVASVGDKRVELSSTTGGARVAVWRRELHADYVLHNAVAKIVAGQMWRRKDDGATTTIVHPYARTGLHPTVRHQGDGDLWDTDLITFIEGYEPIEGGGGA